MEGNAGKRKQADRAITDGKDCENHIANNRKSMKLGDHVIACPVCCQNFVGIPESLREKHVNGCLDKQDSFEQKEEFGQDIMTEHDRCICPHCNWDISYQNKRQREKHIIDCTQEILLKQEKEQKEQKRRHDKRKRLQASVAIKSPVSLLSTRFIRNCTESIKNIEKMYKCSNCGNLIKDSIKARVSHAKRCVGQHSDEVSLFNKKA